VQLAESKLEGLLEAAFDAIVAVDANGIVILANSHAERLFGYAHNEMAGQRVDLLVPNSTGALQSGSADHKAAHSRRVARGAGTDLTGHRRDGTRFPAEISLSAIDTDDGVLISAAIRDVSDRLAAQAEGERLRAQAEHDRLGRQLQQAEHLESLGRLAGGVAHDFNNLLCAITNYSQFVGEEVAAAADGDTGRDWQATLSDINQIQVATQRASALTHQLLAFARREPVKPMVVDLNEVIRDVEPLLRLTCDDDIDLVVTLALDLDHIKADSAQMEQVLVNLATNSRYAMPEGGSLTIDTENVVVDGHYAEVRPELEVGSYVRLRVSDTGTGMTPDVVERAFEPFFTTKPEGAGTGLGLATVYGIVTQAGGHAHIYSEPGVGTTFSMLFPRTSDAPTGSGERQTGESIRSECGGQTVLVVEDEDLLRDVTTRILTRAGYNVITSANGPEALRLATAYDGPIDLLLTDVVMPKMSGKDFAQRLVAARPETLVLFMSGYAESVLGAKGNLEPGVILIDKPFSEPTLLAKIRAVLGVG
jgi:PAS domain S-box-containing protein